MRIVKILVMSLACFCAGCSVTLTKTRFYIETKSLPMITNDSSYGQDNQINNRIMVNGNKIEAQRIYKF